MLDGTSSTARVRTLRNSLLAAAVLAALAAVPEAQTARVKFLRVNRPVKSASLDLATGTITRGRAVHERVGSTIADFTNLDLGGFVGIETGGGACEWIDAGAKGSSSNASDLVSELVFTYCTSLADPVSGGPGGSVLLGFYEGYATGGPAPTTAVAFFNLTGLPGHTANCSVISMPIGTCGSCFSVSVLLDDCIAFADGPIGYSWRFVDFGTTTVLAGTFPFLSCVQSCSGVGPDAQGMVDLIDQYCPPGGPANTFTFGTTPQGSYFTSIAMEIREVTDAEASAASWNSQGINTDVLSSSAIAIGSTWETAIALGHAHGAAGPTNINVRTSCINGPNLVSPTGHPFELLIGGPLNLVRTDAHDGTSADYEPDFAVPCDVSLVGLAWAAQGTVLGGGRADLTTARCGVVGSVDFIADS